MTNAIQSVEHRVFDIIERSSDKDRASKVFDVSIVLLISINVLFIILESYPQLSVKWAGLFRTVELISVAVFTLEYAARVWTAHYRFPRKRRAWSIARYLISFFAVIDLAAILPFYLPMLVSVDLRFLRILRLTRLLRILKVGRYTESFDMIARVVNSRKEELLVTVFVTFLLLLLASSAMYYIEADRQPEAFPNVIASFWWAIATLTTVGYGDVYPVTPFGKLLSAVIAILGIGIVALPTGIISSGFLEEFQTRRSLGTRGQSVCPHCGRELDH